jgi:hypothetical protein
MQLPLVLPRIGRGRQLGSGEVNLEELVGNDKPAAGVAVEQMVAAGEPEILHRL